MQIELKYSNVKPEWNWGGFLIHYELLDEVFKNQKLFQLNYFPQNQSLEIMLTKDEAKNIYLIYSNNDLDYGEKVFVKENVSTFNSKMVKVRFILDIKYSYYLLMSKNETLKNIKIWTTRHNDLNDLNFTFADDYLDFEFNNDFIINNYPYPRDDDQSQRDRKRYRFNEYDLTYGKSDYGIEYINWKEPIGGEPDIINPVLYFVFSKQWDGETDVKYTIIPVMAHEKVSSTPADHLTQIKFIKFNSSDDPLKWTQQDINNGWDNIISLYKKSFANQLVGVFWAPNLLHLNPTLLKVKKGNTENGTQPFLVFEMKEQGIALDCFIPLSSAKTNQELYYYNNRDLYFMGVNLRNYGILTNKNNICGLELKGMMSFGGTMTLNLLCGKRSPYEMVIPLPSFINYLTDEYAKFIQANYNQINTSLQVAKQNALFGGLSSALTGAVGIAGGIVSGNALSATAGVSSLSFGIGKSILGYSQQKRKIDSMLADRKASTNNQLLSSNEQTNSLLLYLLRTKSVNNNIEDTIIINEINDDVKLKYQRLLNQFGYYSPKYKSFDEINQEIKEGESKGYLFEELSFHTQFGIEVAKVDQISPLINNELIELLTENLLNLKIKRSI